MMGRFILVLLALMLAGEAQAVTCTSIANRDWNSSRAWTGCNGGQPPAGANVVIANGTTIQADSNTNTVGNITINAGGTLQGKRRKTITLTGNFTSNGTFTASRGTVAFVGTAQTITGNITFANLTVGPNTVLTLAGNITITGTTNLTAANIASTCPVNYTVNANGAVLNSCAGGGGTGGGGGGTTNTCNGLPAALTSGTTLGLAQTGFMLNTGGGQTQIVNSTVAPATTLAATGNLNALTINSAPTTALTATLPPLNPAAFPAIAGTNGALSNGGRGRGNNNLTVAPGSYTTITLNGGTAAFSGGTTPTYIQNLTSAAGTTLQFAPGDYFIDSLTVGGSLVIGPTQGLVRLFIGTQQVGAYGAATTGGNNRNGFQSGAQINTGGDPANLQLLLYPLVTYFEFSNNVQFTGIMYQPSVQAGAPLQTTWFPTNGATGPGFDLHAGVSITGSLYTPGTIKTQSSTRNGNVVFNYTPQVANAISSFSTCGMQSAPDHILISHGGTALTCSPQTVTLTACADAACTSNYTGTVSGTLSPGGAVFTITNGTATATVQQTTAGTATLGATAITPTPAATTPVTCSNTVSNAASCAMNFNSAGFVITVPNHVACTDATVTIEAMQAGTNNRCVPAYATTTRPVNLSISYANPATGTQSVTDIGNNSLIGTTAAAHNLTFDANGKATLTMGYPDVGQVTLTANDTAPTGAAMTGNASFVAAPAALALSVAPASPIKAGAPFDATVTALTGTGSVCPTAVQAPNYGHETVTQLEMLHTLGGTLAGTGAADPALTASTFAAQASGVTATQSWNEIGDINLKARLLPDATNAAVSNYLGYVLPQEVSATTALRFMPDHFDTAIVQTGTAPQVVPMNCPPGLVCPAALDVNGAGYNAMVYSGQPFTVQVTAKNLAGGTTANYDAALAYAHAVALTAWKAPGDTVNSNPGGGALSGNSIAQSAFAAGVATSATPVYDLAAMPSAPVDAYIRATDTTDGVTSSATEGGVKVASGRFKLPNAYGSERLPLTVNAAVQYYDGGNWVASSTDNSTSFTAANVVAAIVQGPLTTVSVSGGGTMVNGGASVVLNSNGVAGSADISINAPIYLTNTAGRATFGVYKGGNEFIYQRERF